jgi:hypothetical protein
MPRWDSRRKTDAAVHVKAMNVASAEKFAQEKILTALEYEAVEEHHTKATVVSSEPKKLSATWQRPNTCGCNGCQAAGNGEEPTTISNTVLSSTILKLHTALAAELTAHGVEVKKDGKLLRLADLRALADEFLVGKGAYVLTVSKASVAKPPKKKKNKVHHITTACASHTHIATKTLFICFHRCWQVPLGIQRW